MQDDKPTTDGPPPVRYPALGRPPIPVEKQEAILVAVAGGQASSEIAEDVGVSPRTVRRYAQLGVERVEAIRERIRRKVLAAADRVTEAQLTAAADPEKRHGPQAYRVVMEAAGIISHSPAVHIGDNIAVTDARSVTYVHLTDADLEREMEAVRARLLGGTSGPSGRV